MRRLLALADGFGPASQSAWGVTGGWSTQEHLLATIADRVEEVRHTVMASAPTVTFRKQDIRYVTRPNMTARPTARMSPREFFAQMQEGGGRG